MKKLMIILLLALALTGCATTHNMACLDAESQGRQCTKAYQAATWADLAATVALGFF